jgi:Arc/MetJ family transcription regulator
MRTTLNLDDDLVKQALAATGAKSKTEVIELGLKSLVEGEARRQLKLARLLSTASDVRSQRGSAHGGRAAAQLPVDM